MLEVAWQIGAVVSALVGVGALGWKVYTWHHAGHPHLEVEIANAFPTYGPNVELGKWCLSVTAVNRGDHPVHVSSAGFMLPNGDESSLVILRPPYPGALPASVQPRDSGHTWIERKAIEDSGVPIVNQPMVGWVRLSTGERFESNPRVLVGS